MKPTEKNPDLDRLIKDKTGIDRRASVTTMRCAIPDCTMSIHTGDFKDAISIREFKISGLCQACQDSVFIPADDCAGTCGPEVDRPQVPEVLTDKQIGELPSPNDRANDRANDQQCPYKEYLLNDQTINSDIISCNRARRYRAKERQAQELYINSLIKAVPKERLNKETVSGIINAALKGW